MHSRTALLRLLADLDQIDAAANELLARDVGENIDAAAVNVSLIAESVTREVT